MSQGKILALELRFFVSISLISFVLIFIVFTFTFYFANTSKEFQFLLTSCVLISAAVGQSLNLHLAPIFSYLFTNCIIESYNHRIWVGRHHKHLVPFTLPCHSHLPLDQVALI